MDAEYICTRLKRLMKAMSNQPESNIFAREMENGLYTFGVRKPLLRNTVSKQVAVFLIVGNNYKK